MRLIECTLAIHCLTLIYHNRNHKGNCKKRIGNHSESKDAHRTTSGNSRFQPLEPPIMQGSNVGNLVRWTSLLSDWFPTRFLQFSLWFLLWYIRVRQWIAKVHSIRFMHCWILLSYALRSLEPRVCEGSNVGNLDYLTVPTLGTVSNLYPLSYWNWSQTFCLHWRFVSPPKSMLPKSCSFVWLVANRNKNVPNAFDVL